LRAGLGECPAERHQKKKYCSHFLLS